MRHTHIYTKYTEGNSTRLVCACDVALTVTYKGAVMVDDDTEPEEGAGTE